MSETGPRIAFTEKSFAMTSDNYSSSVSDYFVINIHRTR